jgi:Asp/Glu/hydantoin racemase
VLIIGPTSASWEDVAEEVTADLERLRRRDLALSYRRTAAGPPVIRCEADVVAAAPHVVRAAMAAASEGFDAVIVDCTDDPGVAAARHAAGVPVIGAGEALRVAIADAPRPVRLFSGDELRQLATEEVLLRARGARTVALGATGFSHLVDQCAALDTVHVVLDPLDVAVELCLAALRGADDQP